MRKPLLVSLSVLSMAAGANALVIDDFTSGAYSNTIQSGTVIASQAGTMLGNERDTLMRVTNNPHNLNFSVTIGSGIAAISNDVSVDSLFGLDYDGSGDEGSGSSFHQGPGLGNLNFSSFDRFRFNFIHVDLPISLTVEVSTYGSGVSSGTFTVPANSNPQTFDVMFSSLSGSANFSDVDRLTFYFDGLPSADFAMRDIQAVPEPATIAWLIAGVAGLVARRRR